MAHEPWLPSLDDSAQSAGWAYLAKSGITPETYSTKAVLHGERGVTNDCACLLTSSSNPWSIELLDQADQDLVAAESFSYLSEIDCVDVDTVQVVNDAAELVRASPSLYATAAKFLRCLHLLRADSAGHDVSFSLPDLPFSAFVSIPPVGERYRVLRLAEGIVHETMHLKLSLVERVIPLVRSTDKVFASPWKNDLRPAGGLLHGVFVFSAMDFWLNNLPDHCREYSALRHREISSQILGIDVIPETELTWAGLRLWESLRCRWGEVRSVGVQSPDDGNVADHPISSHLWQT